MKGLNENVDLGFDETVPTCVRVSPLVSGMTHQDQREVRRQMREKEKRVGEMPNARHRFGITSVSNGQIWRCFDNQMC